MVVYFKTKICGNYTCNEWLFNTDLKKSIKLIKRNKNILLECIFYQQYCFVNCNNR